jgi:hypothetical protein
MNLKRTGWIFCLIAGMAGGAISVRLFPQSEALAEKPLPHKRVVTAEDFHLVDRAGKLRGALFVSARGEPGFALFDPEGKSRILLMLNADGSAVVDLKDKNEQSRASISLSAEQEPEIKMTGAPRINLLDKEKGTIWKAP